jgi:tRNA(Arg) A34 adenosine deaminase TadA
MSRKKPVIKAVIYDRKGRVLSIGFNSYIKTHPMQAKHAAAAGEPDRTFLHAEIHAIVRCRDLSRADKIFVSRWDSLGRPKLAKPCKVCQSAIKAAGITRIHHT